MEIIDNFLDEESFLHVKKEIESLSFPWMVSNIVTPECFENHNDTEYEEKFNAQLSHLLYEKHCPVSNYFSVCVPLIEKIKPLSLIKVKANLRLYCANPDKDKFFMHNDFYKDSITTAIYYVNTNDGYTLFETGERVESVENRLLRFPSKMTHVGVGQTNTRFRYVININFVENQEVT